MKPVRPLALLLLALTVAGRLGAATPDKEKTKTHGLSVSGTVARTDDVAKTFSVRTAAGKETTLSRTSATKLNGAGLKAGDHVAVRYLERDGKKIATSIRVEPPAVASATPTASADSSR
jgi:hypothetical protein